jgi:hypothetical protein
VSVVKKTNKTFVGLHIPKCAGTSFLDMALEHLPERQIFQTTSIIMNLKEDQPEFLHISDYRALRVVWGHGVHEQMLHFVRSPILFTGMREPVARLMSAARYQVRLREKQGRGPLDLESWIASQNNPMTWFIINRFPTLAGHPGPGTPFEKAKRALQAFHYVYFTDTFASGVAAIFAALGVNAAVKESNVGDRAELKLRYDPAQLEHDIALYEWARAEFGRRKFDLHRKNPAPLRDFLAQPADIAALEEFMLRAQAGEYALWGMLEEVISARAEMGARLLREAKYCREFLAGRRAGHATPHGGA